MQNNHDYKNFKQQVTVLENYDNGQKIKVTAQIPFEAGWVENMKLFISGNCGNQIFQMNHIKNENEYSFFERELFLENSALYKYWFAFELEGRFMYYKKINNTGLTNFSDVEAWKLSVGFDVPEWAKGAVMYHIFVDRFKKGDNPRFVPMKNRIIHEDWNELPIVGEPYNGRWNVDFFGGNLQGIEESLDYIKSLGTTVLYLSPIVTSQSNHRYDTADYEEVDPYAGSNEALKSLCEAAHRKHMYVVLDAVFNHTGNDSKYFNEFGTYPELGAYQSPDSKYKDFFKREYVNGREYFSYWWGMKNLPVCDGNSPVWKNYILGEGGVIDKWFNLGVDGLRLDVADELTDDFIAGIRTAVHRNKKDGFVIGEVWKNPMRMNRGYISSGRCMDSVMNYVLVDSLIRYYKYSNIDYLKEIIRQIQIEYPEGTVHTLMNFTSTHDISRLIEICSCNEFALNREWSWDLEHETDEFVKKHELSRAELEIGKKILKGYVSTLAFMPGIFSIFYGDEVGLQGIGNLMNRTTYPWGERDRDLLKFFRKLGKTRNKLTFLKNADINVKEINSKYIMFERYTDEEKILIVASRRSEELKISIPEEYQDAEIIYKIGQSNKQNLDTYGIIILK